MAHQAQANRKVYYYYYYYACALPAADGWLNAVPERSIP